MLQRPVLEHRIRRAIQANPVTALFGPRQCGKTTMARQIAATAKAEYFDLEHPASARRLSEPLTALEPLRGLVVIDEVQRQPDLFPVLRVLADRRPLAARFLVLGSASELNWTCSSSGKAGAMAWRSSTPMRPGSPNRCASPWKTSNWRGCSSSIRAPNPMRWTGKST